MGQSDTPHTVSVGLLNNCDCSDFSSALCKHMLFVLIKVLKVKRDVLHYQNAFVTSELEEIFESAPRAPSTKYILGSGRLPGEIGPVAQKPVDPTDLCPVCYEEMNTTEMTVYCKANCGYSLHAICYEEAKKGRGKGNCLYCGADWIQDAQGINHFMLPESYTNTLAAGNIMTTNPLVASNSLTGNTLATVGAQGGNPLAGGQLPADMSKEMAAQYFNFNRTYAPWSYQT